MTEPKLTVILSVAGGQKAGDEISVSARRASPSLEVVKGGGDERPLNGDADPDTGERSPGTAARLWGDVE